MISAFIHLLRRQGIDLLWHLRDARSSCPRLRFTWRSLTGVVINNFIVPLACNTTPATKSGTYWKILQAQPQAGGVPRHWCGAGAGVSHTRGLGLCRYFRIWASRRDDVPHSTIYWPVEHCHSLWPCKHDHRNKACQRALWPISSPFDSRHSPRICTTVG